jgi:hypothetical protein
VLVISVVVTLLVYWIAEEYAEVLGEHTAGGQLPSRASIQGALVATSIAAGLGLVMILLKDLVLTHLH